ncbi:MAG: tyrosine--tRNA ligase, partial [Minisyncoccales bacterium]
MEKTNQNKNKDVLSVQKKLELIKRNTEEVLGEEDLVNLLEEKETPLVYWGTAPTGRPHAGYLLAALKVADLLKAGFKVKILIADLHAALDNTPWLKLEYRYDYYSKIIPLLIKSIGVDTEKLEFIKGSEMQLKPEYMYDVLQLSSLVSIHDSSKAASEVVKQSENPRVSGLIYPLMQAVDEEYLQVDAQLGGTDQRKIMVLARENLPKIGYKERIEILNPMVPGLIGKKMSSSDEKSKVDLLDSPEDIKKKIKGADCVEGDTNNGVIAFVKYILMTLKSDKGEPFLVKRPEKYGGNLEYNTYEDLEKDFVEKKLHPLDLKNAVAEEIAELLKPIREKEQELSKIAEKGW